MTRRLAAGSPEPLGVVPVAGGINIAVFSAHATAIELCLFDEADREVERIRLPERTGDVFHGFVAGVEAGARYGLRAHGLSPPGRATASTPRSCSSTRTPPARPRFPPPPVDVRLPGKLR
jgi:glycogen operon protein